MSRRELSLPVTRPNDELVGSVVGLLKFGWLVKLKISARNCTLWPVFTPEVLEQRDVPLVLARPVDAVARRVAERPIRRRNERRRIEPEVLVGRPVRELAVGVRRGIADLVVGLREGVADAGDIGRRASPRAGCRCA